MPIIRHEGAEFNYLDLRTWQIRARDFLRQITPGERKRIQAPMGAGKTRVVIQAAFDWLRACGRNVVIFCAPSVTVTKQVYYEFVENCTIPVFLSGNNLQAPLGARVVCCTHSKLGYLLDVYAQKYIAKDLLLIFIECHHDNFYAVANHKATKQFCTVIGESASPWTKACEEYYGDDAFIYPLTQALKDEVISPFKLQYGEPRRSDLRELAISYQPTIDKAHIHYDMDPEQIRRVIRRWQNGQINPIRVCGMLTEGFDSPYTCDVILKESASQVFTYQCFGRGLRYLRGKEFTCWIKDTRIGTTLERAIKRAG